MKKMEKDSGITGSDNRGNIIIQFLMSSQELEELNQSIIGKDGITYCDEACCQKEENDEIQ